GCVEFGIDRLALGVVADAVEYQPNIGSVAECKADLLEEPRTRIGVNGDGRNIAKRGSRLGEAVSDGLRGEARPMLDAPEPLLLRRGYDLAVAEQAGGAIGVVGVKSQDHHASDLGIGRLAVIQVAVRDARNLAWPGCRPRTLRP